MVCDYLIIGQGLAGSLAARELQRRNLSFQVADPGPAANASRVAAGIYNPITGKRWVRTWNDTVLIPYAKTYYAEFEEQTGLQIHSERPILRLFQNAEDRERMHQRCEEDPIFKNYVSNILGPEELPEGLKAPLGGVVFSQGGYVDTLLLTASIRKELEHRGQLLQTEVHPGDLSIQTHGVHWQGTTYRQVLFCEGYRLSSNPWFQAIPCRHAKGEILTLEVPDLSVNAIVNAGIFILPQQDGAFKIGATYEWEDLSEAPTDQGRRELLERFEALCSLPYTVVDHQAGVRPIAFDRAPVAGRHPEHPALAILNGFGSKGVLYGPYYSRMLIDHLESDKPIEEKVSLAVHWKPDRPA